MNRARRAELQVERSSEAEMAWLLRGGEVLASLDVARSISERARQMAGRDPAGAALLVLGMPLAHSFGSRGRLDVAYLDIPLTVVALHSLAPRRVALWRPKAHHLLIASSGAFERWQLVTGDQLVVTA